MSGARQPPQWSADLRARRRGAASRSGPIAGVCPGASAAAGANGTITVPFSKAATFCTSNTDLATLSPNGSVGRITCRDTAGKLIPYIGVPWAPVSPAPACALMGGDNVTVPDRRAAPNVSLGFPQPADWCCGRRYRCHFAFSRRFPCFIHIEDRSWSFCPWPHDTVVEFDAVGEVLRIEVPTS
jgi:hypothetical protein